MRPSEILKTTEIPQVRRAFQRMYGNELHMCATSVLRCYLNNEKTLDLFKMRVPCPVCLDVRKMETTIICLNDHHGWTFKQIGEWLEKEVEPKLYPEKEPQPEYELV